VVRGRCGGEGGRNGSKKIRGEGRDKGCVRENGGWFGIG